MAIDSNRRVIYDRQRGSHVVRLDETVYTYEPPVRPSSVSGSDVLPQAAAAETTQTPAPDGATERDTAPSEPQPSASDTDDSGGEPEQSRTDDTTRADDDTERQ